MRCSCTPVIARYFLLLALFALVLIALEGVEAGQGLNSSNRQQREAEVVLNRAAQEQRQQQQQHEQQHQQHQQQLLPSKNQNTDININDADIASRPRKNPSGFTNPSRRSSPSTYSSHSAAISSADQRQIEDWKLADFLLIATVDGSLHACERDTGIERWSLGGEGSVVKTFSDRSLSDDDEELTWIVEPLGDGALYYFTPNSGLQKLPISIKQLVSESPFSVNGDDKVYTGYRLTTLYSVDARTGRILKVFGSGAPAALCPRRRNLEDFEDDDNDWEGAVGDRETFLVGRTEYRLEISSQSSDGGKAGAIWNVTYSTWGPNNMDTDLMAQHTMPPDNLYVYPLHDGVILGVDRFNETRSWSRILPSPAITTFDVFAPYESIIGRRSPYILLPQPAARDTKYESSAELSTFVSRTDDGGWYALSAQNFPVLVESAPIARWNLGVMSFDAENQRQSLIGVHDGKRSSSVMASLPGIEGGPMRTPPQIGAGSGSSLSSRLLGAGDGSAGGLGAAAGSSLPMRALVDIALVLPMLLAAYYLLLRKRGVREFLFDTAVEEKSEPVTEREIDVVATTTPEKEAESTSATPVDEISSTDKDDTASPTTTATAATPAKKRKRGARGGRRTQGNKENKETAESKSVVVVEDRTRAGQTSEGVETSEVVGGPSRINSLEVSDVVLGYGSHGTVVYAGTFENREVAVKRMLLDFYDVASHEISLLQESDDHPNIVRYFCKQESEKFLYIALELCPATLQDVIDRPQEFSALVERMADPRDVLSQIANGLRYLHSLKIVHRDIKPQNILVAPPKKLRTAEDEAARRRPARLLISDFGLCKKLEGDQSSFRATTAHAAGTSGWRAPELLIDGDDSYANGGGSSSSHTIMAAMSSHSNSNSEPAVIDSLSNRRATRAIDIFSLGCVFYFFLSHGSHPFGDRYLREANIVKGEYALDFLDVLGAQGVQARDLISRMIERDPNRRPSAGEVLAHPYFWSSQKKLDFLLEVSDRFEIEPRDPPSELLGKLESDPEHVVYNDWYKRLDKSLIENLGKYRKYHTDKVLDLLRALRNKKHHYQDLPPNVRSALGKVPEGFLGYFEERFPNLVMHVYFVVRDNLRDEPQFRPYFCC
ncbi:hypothetical protein BZA70DRAFT_259474 [Myxozyma melibiosi]|uniref:non-specific serine/threonine protein kinase n=1 Tax=Myxozyma melibiosi TaxID=54550 RepID=A0ABR1F1P4_9ASCO